MNIRIPALASDLDCTGCMLCADVCTKDAITFFENKNGFWEVKIENEKCVGCLICQKKCAEVRNSVLSNYCVQPLRGHSKSKDVRLKSTSGGVFYAIAEHAIHNMKAIVYGVVCEGTKVFHRDVETINDLKKLQGSKYAQSYSSGVYRSVKEKLKIGRFVIFSGTPCQVNALRVYLGKDYDNLLCVDLICHGVPSNILMYRHLEINNGDGILEFRTKSKGWGRDSFITISRNGKSIIIEEPSKNLFYHAFQSEQCFRMNCYKCRYNKVERTGDITIGDYWAIRYTDEYDELGESTILPNTEKGRVFLKTCDSLVTQETSWENSLKNNPRLYKCRDEYLKIALSSKIYKLYKFLPQKIADYIIEAWYSKRRHIFFLWAYAHKKKIDKLEMNH